MSAASTSLSPGDAKETGDDLIDSFQLPVRFNSDSVEHVRYVTDVRRGIRNAAHVERWSRKQELGRGGFGTVYLETESRGQVRAVKEVRKYTGHASTMDHLREILAMAHFTKAEALFVKLEGWYQSNEHIYIVMEYFPNGDLHKCVSSALPEQEGRIITHQLLEALEWMHERNFTHRDLKPSNIFVVFKNPNWWVKLGDFGVSKRVKNNITSLHTTIETDFTAPEVTGHLIPENEDICYTSVVDIWSLGCLVHWLLTYEMPLSRRELLPYCRGSLPFPEQKLKTHGVSQAAVDFIRDLLKPQPTQRTTASQGLQTSWPLNAEVFPAVEESSVADPHIFNGKAKSLAETSGGNSKSKEETERAGKHSTKPWHKDFTEPLRPSLKLTRQPLYSLKNNLSDQSMNFAGKRTAYVSSLACTNLVMTPVGDLPNPFAVVSVDGGPTQETAICRGTKDPAWDQTFELIVDNDSKLMFEVYDFTNSIRRQYLGEARLWLREAECKDRMMPYGKVGYRGNLSLEVLSRHSATTVGKLTLTLSIMTFPGTSLQSKIEPQTRKVVPHESNAPSKITRRRAVIASFDFAGLQPGDLSFKQGDAFEADVDEDDKGTWTWWTGYKNNKTGVFPANYVHPAGDTPLQTAAALFDFVSRTRGDLSFKEGDILQVHPDRGKDWWVGYRDGNIGLFPANYVELR